MQDIKEGYTRVSDILGQWNHLSHIDPNVLENKCRIGTNVHNCISAEINSIYMPLEEDEKGYYDSWLEWHEKYKKSIAFIANEKRFYCDEYKITGCVDAIIALEGEGQVLVDYKTSSTANKKIWALQAQFYIYLAGKNGYSLQGGAWFLKLKKNGKLPTQYSFYPTPDLWKTCKGAIFNYRYFND